MSGMIRGGALALLMATGLVGPAGPAAAGPDGVTALSPTPKYIVKSPAGKLDNLFETVATSNTKGPRD